MRIVLEVRRDGARLLEAERQGASIADLAEIFAQDIERPGIDTSYHRRSAIKLFGADLALERHPNHRLHSGEAAWRPHWDL